MKEDNTNVLSCDTSNQQKDVDGDSPGTEEPKNKVRTERQRNETKVKRNEMTHP